MLSLLNIIPQVSHNTDTYRSRYAGSKTIIVVVVVVAVVEVVAVVVVVGVVAVVVVVVVVAVVVVVSLLLNRSFYPTTATAVSVLILHPREIQMCAYH